MSATETAKEQPIPLRPEQANALRQQYQTALDASRVVEIVESLFVDHSYVGFQQVMAVLRMHMEAKGNAFKVSILSAKMELNVPKEYELDLVEGVFKPPATES